jgi:hypothetical protein
VGQQVLQYLASKQTVEELYESFATFLAGHLTWIRGFHAPCCSNELASPVVVSKEPSSQLVRYVQISPLDWQCMCFDSKSLLGREAATSSAIASSM